MPTYVKRSDFRALVTEILGRGSGLRFRVRGGSMFPFIQDGDLLEVQPPGAMPIVRGDVVLCCRQDNGIVAHRVVQVQQEKGQVKLLIRGDALPKPDGVISLHAVWGRVVAVERGGRCIPLNSGLQRWLGLAWSRSPQLCSKLNRVLVVLKRIAS